MPDSLEQLDLVLIQVAKAGQVRGDGIHFPLRREMASQPSSLAERLGRAAMTDDCMRWVSLLWSLPMTNPTSKLSANVLEGLLLIASAVENDLPVDLGVKRTSGKWKRCIEPALHWIHSQSDEPNVCPHCKAKFHRGTSFASHLGRCPYGPKLLRRRKPDTLP
jgi:hypothetical protein